MTQLFTVQEMLEITRGRLHAGRPETPVTGFAYDSRQVRPGDCFVAMPGERVDGHDFAAKAAEQGAACILAARPVQAHGAAVILVPDPLTALGQLGRAHRSRYPIPLVGITGSVGKTTTKDLIAAVLSARFRVVGSPGNLNSEVGLPVALMALDATCEVAVQEMGMRALGEIAYLVSIAQPTIGVVTNVGPTHLELLGSIENIALAKSELIRGLPPTGTAVLNADDDRVAAMAAVAPPRGRLWFYGTRAEGKGERWVSVREIRRDGEAGQRFTLLTPVGEAEAYLPAPGPHNVLNAMAAVAVGLDLGMTLQEAARGIAGYTPSGSRMRILKARGIRILDDTYNAAPVSTIAALRTMRELAGDGRCIAVLGSMFELGAAAAPGHRQVGAEAARLAEHVLTVGDLAVHYGEGGGARVRHYPDKPALLADLIALVQPGDTVLVKGSRGMAMEEIVQALEKHFA